MIAPWLAGTTRSAQAERSGKPTTTPAATSSRWNAWRRDMMQYRRAQLPGLLLKLGVGIGDRGAQARVVEALGLSRQTISRDFRALVDSMRARRSCPVCRCSVEHLWERP